MPFHVRIIKKWASKLPKKSISISSQNSTKSKKDIKKQKEIDRLENLSATDLIAEGNKLLYKFTFFTSSKIENKLKAIQRFQFAIPLLRVDEKNSEAANLSLQMGEIYDGISKKYRQDKLICYWNAAMYLRESDIPRAILILEKLCYPIIYGYLPRYQVTFYQEIITLHKKGGNLEEAIKYNLTAINYTRKLRNLSKTAKLYANLGYLYSATGENERAINCLKNAAQEILSDITYVDLADAKKYYLDASLIVLYHFPLKVSVEKITSFIHYFPQFRRGNYYWLVHNLIQCLSRKSSQYFDDTIKIYQKSKAALTEWQIGALKNIQILLYDEIGKNKMIDLSI